MSFLDDLKSEPWRFDFFATMRRLERSFPEKPRIGDAAARREEFVALAEEPFLDFPASTISKADADAQGRVRLYTKFLGMLGPQGALPLSTTEEAYAWSLRRDDAFPRFLDILNHRFLQLFYRAWADSRPIAQQDRPKEDRFGAYVGSAIGLGSRPYQDRDSIPDIAKLAFAGLMAPQAKSASRLRHLVAGLFKVEVEIEEFVGTRLAFEPADCTALGARHSRLGIDALVGSSVVSVEDKFRIRIFTDGMAQYRRFLPSGDKAEPLADIVFFYIGDQLDWDVELALPAAAAEPVRLGRSGQLGWTSWMAPKREGGDKAMLCDARFHPAERMAAKRAAASAARH